MGQNDRDCDYCDETFTSKADRIRHTLDEHGDELTGHKKDSLKSQLKKLEQKTAQQKQQRTANLKRYGKGLTVLSILLLVGYGVYSSGLITLNRDTGTDVGVTGPLHWHPQLTIIIDGKPQPIPADIGIGPDYADHRFYGGGHGGMQMTSMHTHDSSGVLHWEVSRRTPREGEMKLGAFFDVWGKTFNETCIFDYCNTEEKQVTMTVNGEPNEEFANYTIRDRDNIVIRYE